MGAHAETNDTYGTRRSRTSETARALARVRAEARAESRGKIRRAFSFDSVGRGTSIQRAIAAGITLSLAVGCGLLAYQLTAEATPPPSSPPARVESTANSAVELVSVLVPIRPIERGQLLTSDLFVAVKKPRFTVTENTVRSFDQIHGQFARALIPSQQPFMLEAASSERSAQSITENIPHGFRAITINVNATSGVEGWARAGAFVDVHWISDALGEKSASLIVQNAKVLSAERTANPDVDPSAPIPTTVTLLVPLRDAQKIGLASTSGSVVLHLRGVHDGGKASASAGTLTVDDLLGGPRDSAGAGSVQGFLKYQDELGATQEIAIIDGSILRKD